MKTEVRNLTRVFGKTVAVNDISFSFEDGNIFGFIGPNGAGKTTTIRIMATLDLATSGDVFYDGVSATLYPASAESVVFFSFFMHINITNRISRRKISIILL